MLSKRGIIVFGAILIVIILFSQFINAESYTDSGMKIDKSNLKYEQRILDEFNKLAKNETNNETFIKVLFYLEDSSRADSLISSFSKEEFQLETHRNNSNSISALITEETFFKLIQDENVKSIYYDFPVQLFLDESAPLINATYVWNTLGFTGDGIKVCVIDSGVDKYHPALQGKIAGEYCYCSSPDNYLNSGDCCPDGTDEDNNATDFNGHGTHVTGIIASQNETYRGISYGVDIYTVKTQNSSGSGAWDDMRYAIEWCINQNVKVISMSLGGGGPYNETNPCPQIIDTDINNATAHNISVIVASGNSYFINGISYPACSPNVISVGATTKQDIITDYTNRGENLDLLAPGGVLNQDPPYSEIVSTFSQRVRNDSNLCLIAEYYWWWPWWPLSGCRDSDYEVNNYFIRVSGTSQATPHVAGAVALMLEKNSTLTPSEIKSILQNTGKFIWDPETQTTYPRIDVLAAVNQVPYCSCTSWTAESCGGGNCISPKKQYTRTCDPSNCDPEGESKCEYDVSCESGGGLGSANEITVCSSGCNYTTIGNAINHSDANDKILVMDNRTYNEQVKMNSTTSGWIRCNNATIKGSNSGTGVYLFGMDGFVIRDCKVDSFSYGIFADNSSHADIVNVLVNNSNVIGLLLKDDSFDIRMENISVLETTGDNAVKFNGYAWSASIVSYNKIEDSVIKKSGAAELIWIDYGKNNQFLRNNFSESASGYEGLLLSGHGNAGNHEIRDNKIFNNYAGIYFKNSNTNEQVNNNTFCPSNTNIDIHDTGTGNSGSNNTCEKPGTWNDEGKTGCTYYCDSPAETELLYPNDESIYTTQNNFNLVCKSDDNYQLVNVTLYHNITGTWQANQTKSISGTSNISIFNFSNIPNGTNFIWNCLAYDNHSRGGFASANWSVKVVIDSISPNVNIISPLNQTYNVSSVDFNATINEYGNCEYSLNNGATNISMGTIDGKNFSATNSSMLNGDYNSNFYCVDAVGNLNYTEKVSFSVNAPIPPNDSHKFYIRNSSGNPVAWFGNLGNIALKGNCTNQTTCTAPANSFIVRNSTDSTTAYVDNLGNLCVEKGDCSDESATCNPSRTAFIIRNSSNYNMSYIDFDGDLCLTGKLYENSNYV